MKRHGRLIVGGGVEEVTSPIDYEKKARSTTVSLLIIFLRLPPYISTL